MSKDDFAQKMTLILKVDELFVNNNVTTDIVSKIDILLTQNQNMKKITLDLLFDKAQNLINVISPNEANEPFFYLRNYFKALIALNNSDVLSSIETHYVSERQIDGFLVFIEELSKANKNIESCIHSFISLLKINNLHYLDVDKFLKVLKKDRFFLIEELINKKLFEELIYYINSLLAVELSQAKEICNIIINKHLELKNDGIHLYNRLTCLLITFYKEACEIFIESKTIDNDSIEDYILLAGISNAGEFDLIKNYCDYISNDKNRFLNFEQSLLKKNSSYFLVKYAEVVVGSSKKLILSRLLELKQEHYIVDFLKRFPKYGHLLPML